MTFFSLSFPNIYHCILRSKGETYEIPLYFQNQSVVIVSFRYTKTVSPTIFTYKLALQDLDLEEYLKNPLTYECSHSSYSYKSYCHVITSDLNIVQHVHLWKVTYHGPNFREPKHINYSHYFKIIMNSIEDYAKLGKTKKD